MRLTALVLTAMLSTTAHAADVFDPDAYGTEPPVADTDSAIYLLCGERYDLPDASIGYIVKSSLNGTVLKFQTVAPGTEPTAIMELDIPSDIDGLKAATERNETFAVYEPVKGQTNVANVSIYAKLGGGCTKVVGPETLTGAEHLPTLVQMMINEDWNR